MEHSEKGRSFCLMPDTTRSRREEGALCSREDQYQILFESNPHPMWVYDLETLRFLAVNDAAISHYGYSKEEFLAMTIKEIRPPEDIPLLLDRLCNILRTAEGFNSSGIWRHQKKDGTIIDVETSSHSLTFNEKSARLVLANDITERKHAEEMVQYLAYHDVLTGLPNRTLLHNLLQQAIVAAKSENRPICLLTLDLNRFKEINNTLGHHNGDIILQQIGLRLQDTLKEADTIARLGGDEFAVLLRGADADAAIKAADMIIKMLEEPFVLEWLSLDVSASIGIALFPDHGEGADLLIRRADIAMNTAKKTESGFCIYSPRYDEHSPERLALMGDLRYAILQNQLFLLYQPKIDVKTCKPIGVEALVRWQHPKSGIIPPDKFISLAEHTGLIKQLTFWVLKEALRQSRILHQIGIETSVAVNLSVRSLQAPQLLEQIKGLFSTLGAESNQLRFEITESIIMADPERAMEIITQLNAMGILFSIDDFGTGYSSLGYLQKLPVDEIKIDKSFVMNMMKDKNSMNIVRSIIELGHNLGLKIVAEGVESLEILSCLASLGCDSAQGYYVSRPIPAPELIRWLKEPPASQI